MRKPMIKTAATDATATAALGALRALAQFAGPNTEIYNRVSNAMFFLIAGRVEMAVAKLDELTKDITTGINVFEREPAECPPLKKEA